LRGRRSIAERGGIAAIFGRSRDDPAAAKASQAEVLAYLRCHGIAGTAQVVAPELRSVGDTLLAVGAEHEASLLVMGAYSHSRLREMLLGGATPFE
jgi:nucleotide-binding universal stress UspA family protein